jgi:hypothetical protein
MKKIVVLCVALAVLTAVVVPVAHANRVNGPGTDSKTCLAFGSVTYHEQFYGNSTAVVSISGDGHTDLDIFVYDLSGRLITQGIGLTDRETVSWYVPVTGTYRIVVRNLGATYNHYGLATN